MANMLLEPTLVQLAQAHTDITKPGFPVEIKVGSNGVVWVNIGPVCVLRICQTTGVIVKTPKTDKGEVMLDVLRKIVTDLIPHVRDTGNNAADREIAETIRAVKRIVYDC